MGDVAMTVPVIRVLAQSYPELKITVLSRDQFKPLFSDLPNLQFIQAEVDGRHKGFFGLWKLAGELKKIGITDLADLHNVIRSKLLCFFLSFKGVKISVLDKGRAEKKELIQANGSEIAPLKSMHERYAEVFKKLDWPLDLSQHIFPERKRLNPRLLNLIGKEPRKCIGIAPFAAYTSKMYPLEQTKELIVQLNTNNKYRVLLFGGGKAEIEQLKELEIHMENVSNVAGELTFGEELDLISNLDLMVSMDSSNGHLAAMLGVPVITLWGVTHPYAGFTPFQQPNRNQLISNREQYPLIPTSIYGNKFPEGYENVMETIPSSLVLSKIEELIA